MTGTVRGKFSECQRKILPLRKKFLAATLPDMPPWSEADIRKRIRDRLDELGMSLSALPDTLRKNAVEGWKRGPTLGTLQTIADRLRLTLPQLLGIEPAAAGLTDPAILLQAIKITGNAIAPEGTDCPLISQPVQVAELTAIAYRMIATMAQERPDAAFSDDALFAVASHLRYLVASADDQKS
jgi:hypothetical protein